jgi:hypothetical protein
MSFTGNNVNIAAAHANLNASFVKLGMAASSMHVAFKEPLLQFLADLLKFNQAVATHGHVVAGPPFIAQPNPSLSLIVPVAPAVMGSETVATQ